MNKPREELIAYVDGHAGEQLQFLIDLCSQNSHTHHKAGVDRVAAMVLDRLEGILPEHEVFEQTEVGNHHLLKNTSASKALYLVGHMDTVFPSDHPFQKCHIKKERLTGPGSGDMKGGLAVFVYALKALKAAGLMGKLRLALMLGSDEEIGSITSRSLYEKHRENAAACLGGECAGRSGEIVVSRNGKIGARIDCFGEERHVGSGTHEKTSAILGLAHNIIAIESLNQVLPGVSINVGKVEGGLGPSTVPAQATALLDIRWVEPSHGEVLLQRVQEGIRSSSQAGCRTSFTVLNSRPPMPLHEGTNALLRAMQQAGQYLGQSIRPEHRRGTSDVNYFASAGVPTLDGLGPVCDGDHTPNEFIIVSSLRERTALLASFLADMADKEIEAGSGSMTKRG